MALKELSNGDKVRIYPLKQHYGMPSDLMKMPSNSPEVEL